MLIRNLGVSAGAFLISLSAQAGQMTYFAPKIAAESMGPKYSEAAQKATQAFLVQSKVGAHLDAMEIYASKRLTSKARNLIGDEGANVIGASLFLIRCVQDKKITTKVSNPFIGQSHLLSLGLDGVEVSGIKSSIGASHWFRISSDEKEGNRYATGVSFTF